MKNEAIFPLGLLLFMLIGIAAGGAIFTCSLFHLAGVPAAFFLRLFSFAVFIGCLICAIPIVRDLKYLMTYESCDREDYADWQM